MSNVPKLRFKEFTDEWESKKMSDISILKGGYAFKSKELSYIKTNYQVIKMGNLYKNQLLLDRCPSYKKEITEKEKQYILTEGDILITLTGTVGKKDFGYSYMITNEKNLLLNQRLGLIRSKKDISDNRFIKYIVLNSNFLEQFFESSLGGTGNQANVSIKSIEEFYINIPSLQEQEKIGSFLSLVDKKISLQNEKVKALKDYKKGLMQKIFSKELRFKDENGNEFLEWEEKKLRDICEIIMGQSPSSDCYNEDNIGLPLIQGKADIQNRKTFPKIYTSDITKTCDIGDIIMSVRAPVGDISKAIHKACIGRGVCSLKPKENVDFIYQLLINDEKSWEKTSQGSTFESINKNDIANKKILLPSLKEQQKIANLLSSIDLKIEKEQEKLDLLECYKKGLLQQMFV